MSLFTNLWHNYPRHNPCEAKDEKGDPLFSNQCAIRLSHALNKSGVSLRSFPGKRKCWIHKERHEVLAAKELADWLDSGAHPQIGRAVDIAGADWRTKVVNRTGIICFEDYYAASGGSGGDHIDLWDGSSLTALGSWLRTRLGIVVPGFWSDFRRSRRIRFFEVA